MWTLPQLAPLTSIACPFVSAIALGFPSPLQAAKVGYIDDVILPRLVSLGLALG